MKRTTKIALAALAAVSVLYGADASAAAMFDLKLTDIGDFDVSGLKNGIYTIGGSLVAVAASVKGVRIILGLMGK